MTRGFASYKKMLSTFSFLVVALGLISLPTVRAEAMATEKVKLMRQVKGGFWYFQWSTAEAVKEAILVASSETVVDQLDGLDASTNHVCDVKYRLSPLYNTSGRLTAMVYDVTNCSAAGAAGSSAANGHE